MTGLSGKDSQHRTARIRQLVQKERRQQPEKDRHSRQLEQGSQNGTGRARFQADRTDRPGLPVQHCQDRAAQMGQAKQDRKMMACRSEMLGQGCQPGLLVHDCQYMWDCQDRTPVQDCQDRTFLDMTSGKEQSKQFYLLYDIALILNFI
jgi:hypothetical protein